MRKTYIRKVLWMIATVVLLWLLAVVSIITSARPHIFTTAYDAPKADAAIILGAAVLKNGGLSPVLRDRVDKAIELYRGGQVKKIIASGDNTTREYNEVQPIRNYLIEHNIPASDIFLDYAGFNTYSSIYRAKEVYLVTSLDIVSQSFHLSRAVYIARALGIDAAGVSADRGKYKMSNYLREMAADAKAVLDLAVGHRPKYLGETLPIWGDGRSSLP